MQLVESPALHVNLLLVESFLFLQLANPTPSSKDIYKAIGIEKADPNYKD